MYKGVMTRGRPKKLTDPKAVPFFINITPEAAADLEEYAVELKQRTPGIAVTRQDAMRAVLASWSAKRRNAREAGK